MTSRKRRGDACIERLAALFFSSEEHKSAEILAGLNMKSSKACREFLLFHDNNDAVVVVIPTMKTRKESR
jgi:hypothetical protein